MERDKVMVCQICGGKVPPDAKICGWCDHEIIPLATPQEVNNG